MSGRDFDAKVSYPAGGIRVELDDSECVILRVPKINPPDTIVTVTDVQLLIDGLYLVGNQQRHRQDRPPLPQPVWQRGDVYRIAAGEWLVASQSTVGDYHTVKLHYAEGVGQWYTCSCRAGTNRGRMGIGLGSGWEPACRHVRAANVAEIDEPPPQHPRPAQVVDPSSIVD